MSLIVSRRPPALGSVSQANDRRWISIRFGTSRTFSRRAKLRRARGASTAATWATPQTGRDRAGGAHEVRPAKIAQQADAPSHGRPALTVPAPAPPYVAEAPPSGGCGYRPIGAECSGVFGISPARQARG